MKTIEIATAQHVTIQYQLATWGVRLLAFIIDWVIGLVTYLLTSLLVAGILSDYETLFYRLWGIVMLLFYTLGWEYFNHGQTPGKYITGIKVLRLDGSAPSLSDYLTRIVFRTLDIYLSLGSLATTLILSSPRNQRLGDINANTIVVQLARQSRYNLTDFERLDALADYVPQYPEVTRLTEQDMLLIKQLLERLKRYPNPSLSQATQDLYQHILHALELPPQDRPPRDFFQQLLKDYVILTR